MGLFIKLYATAIAAFVVLDTIWIGVIARSFYTKHLAFLLGNFKPVPAVLFYLIYAAGVVYLIVEPSMGKPLLQVFLTGALLGLMAFGAYDLTNQATVRDWPVMVTVVDMLWGACASGTVATAVVSIGRTFFM